MLKTADYVALEGEYRRAIDIYEQIGMSRADHHLLKWGAKDIYFKVGTEIILDREQVPRGYIRCDFFIVS